MTDNFWLRQAGSRGRLAGCPWHIRTCGTGGVVNVIAHMKLNKQFPLSRVHFFVFLGKITALRVSFSHIIVPIDMCFAPWERRSHRVGRIYAIKKYI